VNCINSKLHEEKKSLKERLPKVTNNVSLQKEIISLDEKNSVYMEQLKEKNNYVALCCRLQSQQTETASVLKSSVATNTDISGTLCCVFFTKCTLVNWSVWLPLEYNFGLC